MLIISRRKGQRIVIGHDTEIVVTELSRSTVKLGIRAPAQTQVLRGEVWDSIENANREAATGALDDEVLGGAKPAAAAESPLARRVRTVAG
jgi:carbon storage regulator